MPVPIVLLTRPAAQSRAFAERLTQAPPEVRILISPLLEIEPRPVTVLPGHYASYVISSANALDAVPAAAPVYSVGARTAELARAQGLDAHMAGTTADALVAHLTAAPPPQPILHVRGAHTRGAIVPRLRAAGLAADELIAYDQVPVPLSAAATDALHGPAPLIVPLFSPRSAQLFRDQAQSAAAPLDLVAMSLAVADALQGWAVAALTIAEAPTRDAMRAQVMRRIAARMAP